MDETEASPTTHPASSRSRDPSTCEECGENPWKYRCPGCSIRTCALPCVNSHKRRTGCTGKRSHAEIVPISKFDDTLLLSDYNFLEETKRAAESADRLLGKFRRGFGFKLPTSLRLLRDAAHRRRTRLLLLPPGMSKRETNQSRYNIKKEKVYWTIEWRFHSTDVTLIDHGVDEDVSLSSVIEKHLVPGPWNHPLKPFCDVNLYELKLYLRKNSKGQKSPFRPLDIKAPLGQQMANVVIVEYPVIHVFLPSHNIDFEVEIDPNLFPKKENSGNSSDNNTLSPRDILFREEEIEEGEISEDTPVLDLMDHMATNKAAAAIGLRDKQVQKSTSEGLEKDSNAYTLKDLAVETCEQSTANVSSVTLSDDGLIDFGQELRDAFADLIGDINPDDFLCLDSGHSEDQLMEGMGHFYVEDLLMEEDGRLRSGAINTRLCNENEVYN